MHRESKWVEFILSQDIVAFSWVAWQKIHSKIVIYDIIRLQQVFRHILTKRIMCCLTCNSLLLINCNGNTKNFKKEIDWMEYGLNTVEWQKKVCWKRKKKRHNVFVWPRVAVSWWIVSNSKMKNQNGLLSE